MDKFLSKKQRQELIDDHRVEHNRRFADRIKSILLLDQGYSFTDVASILLLDETTVRRYKKSYISHYMFLCLKIFIYEFYY